MSEGVEIEVSSQEVALEIGYAILTRAQAIHDGPGDDSEAVAEELGAEGQRIIGRYERDGFTEVADNGEDIA